jgi:uncharacterized membrane protein
MKRLLAPFAAALAFALATGPAHASLRLCNRTSYVLTAATASAGASDVLVQGWTRIVPGSCRTTIQGDLAAAAYYVYARTSSAHSGAPRAWNGNANFCVKDTNFSLRLPLLSTRCPAPDIYERPFAPIVTHHMRSWTTTFRETPDFDSMKSAERAGLKRLLADNGARVGDLRSGLDKAEEAALALFRKRLRLSDKAGTEDLFDALETEAMKTAAPIGYTVCNDTDKPVWAAIAQKNGAVAVSRGWWIVAAGACAITVTDSVAKAKNFLRVEKGRGVALVSGPEKFCVTTIEFEIKGRERCVARGLTEAGFAETSTKGAPGFVAHVSANGLAATLSGNGMPK